VRFSGLCGEPKTPSAEKQGSKEARKQEAQEPKIQATKETRRQGFKEPKSQRPGGESQIWFRRGATRSLSPILE